MPQGVFLLLKQCIVEYQSYKYAVLRRRRPPEAVPETAFRDEKDRLWHHERPSLTRLLSVCVAFFGRKWLI